MTKFHVMFALDTCKNTRSDTSGGTPITTRRDTLGCSNYVSELVDPFKIDTAQAFSPLPAMAAQLQPLYAYRHGSHTVPADMSN